MNKIDRRLNATSYEADYALWCAEQGALLRAGRIDALDRDNLAEEIESLGRSDRYEIESRLEVLLLHLLKWTVQPTKRSSGWRATIIEQRKRIARRMKASPSLKSYPAEVLEDAFQIARAAAASETGLELDAFPETCPFTLDDVLDGDLATSKPL